MDVNAIETIEITKEFRYLNPGYSSVSSDMWWSYILSFATGRRKSYFGVAKTNLVAVDHLNLKVKQGEFFGLLGPNGAGKTTLIKMLATILSPTSGTAYINGHELQREPNKVKASINVVVAGGWLGFNPYFPIRWSLVYWARMYGLSKKEAEKRAKDVLEIVGLEDKVEESAGVLSSGMRQKLALAKGLLIHAPVLLLDEPTVGLDPNAAYAARNFIKHELNQKLGQTVLLTTHYMFEAEQLCDRVAIMDKGKIIACGTPSELKRQAGGNVLLIESLDIGPPVLERLRASKLANRIFSSFSHDGTCVLRIHPHRDQTVKRENIERLLLSEGYQIVSSKIVEPTLEDVFMQLTGKEL